MMSGKSPINSMRELLDMKLNQVRKINRQQGDNIKLLKSRLNHIQHQDIICQKNISRTSNEIQSIISTKSRVNEDQLRKLFLEEIKQKKLEEYSQRAYISKMERLKRSKNVQSCNFLSIQIEKQLYSEAYSFQNKEYKTNLSIAKLQTWNEIYGTNFKSHKLIRQAHLKHQQDKIIQLQLKQQEGQYNYKQKIIQEAQQFKERQLRITELEEAEEQYLLKLKVSQSKNRSMSAKKEEIKRVPAEKISISKNNLFRIN
ncbi:unnamed protein product (macronuclear) [Paramecium tetraurelia]|uniref:Flagellar FliJ protein n=1 Tax=Paramecium tetraurelia TaxID=5888 RepID=A0CEK0_PARTE|nr:uncharacterized protein GSPATT00037655001 [Paramecium tetraurelia]CAK69217.1 unnamed protein product [Paramecium tetraurelia]|eukprot:XP_001436614.1 hypothetical protein (macronuclear) [Paramecium tetraurelia strain d4-2]